MKARARSTRTIALLLLLAPLAVAGCGDLTAGGATGETTVVLSGDADETASTSAYQSSSAAFEPANGTIWDAFGESATSASSPDQPVGDVTATLEVSIQAPDGEWIALTDGLEQANVDIEGRSEAELGTETLGAAIYPRVRVRFTDIQARVEAGLPTLGDIGVDFGEASSITVERQVDLDLADGDAVDVLVDLNSAEWLNQVLPAQHVVAAAHVRNAVEARVR